MAGWGVSKVAVARLAILLSSTSIAGVLLPLPAAFAQTAPSTPSAAGSLQRSITFAIPPQSLSSGIVAFSRAAGVDVVFDGAVPRGARTQGVSGTFVVREGLNQLLAGTGLSARLTNARTVQVYDPSKPVAGGALPAGAIPLDTIDVQGASNPNSTMTPMPEYAGGQVATGGQVGMLGNRSVMDAPFNQTSYTQKTIQDQQARTVSDVLANDPSVGAATGRNNGLEQPVIRGFTTTNADIGINGLYGLSGIYSFTAMPAIARVEVLKGMSALVNGMSPGDGVGGSINLVTKRAGDVPLAELTTSYASRSQFGTHLDAGRRFGDNNEFGVRFNGSYRGGNTEVESQKQELGTAALGLDYRGERLRVSTDLIYDSIKNDPVLNRLVLGGALTSVPLAPNGSRNWMPSWADGKVTNKLGMVQAEYDLAANLTAYGAIGVLDSSARNMVINPVIGNMAGDYSSGVLKIGQDRTNISSQAGLRSSFDTGPVNHALNFNVSAWEGITKIGAGFGTAIASNIYYPPALPVQDPILPTPGKSNATHLMSYGVADTLSILDKRVQLTVGVRKQQVEVDTFNRITGVQTSSYESSAWSPAYAIVVKPLSNVSIYANYIEGLQQGFVVDQFYSNGGQVFPPFQSKQSEVGVKVDWGRLTTTLGVFQIAQPSTLTDTAANTLIVNGENRNRGVEFNVFGEVTENVRLLGGALFMNARQQKTQDGLFDGNKSVGVPDVQVSMGAEWDTPFLRGVTLTGRIIHNTEVFADAANTLTIPAWTRFDLGARYTTALPWNGKPVTFRFAVENVFDKNFWIASTADRQIYLAAPRTFLLAASFQF